MNLSSFFKNPIKSACEWIANALLSEIKKPLEEIKAEIAQQGKKIDAQAERMTQLHKADPIAEECDLAILDDRICYLIGKCREKNFTTAEERRRVGRMHEAYRARGGNHGEEAEYNIFCHLPTEEEHNRLKNH